MYEAKQQQVSKTPAMHVHVIPSDFPSRFITTHYTDPEELYSMKATPTAAPKTTAISLPQPLVITASPVCRPGCPLPVRVDPAPAVPVGVSALSLPPTTVTAVIADWSPLGKVLVWTSVEVIDERTFVFDVDEPDAESVVAPPPTVEMTVRPMELVVVTISPAVSDGEEEGAVVAAEVMVPVSDGLELAAMLGDMVSDPEVVEDSPPRGIGPTRVVAGSGDCCAGVVVGIVPLL